MTDAAEPVDRWVAITEPEFRDFQRLIKRIAGINLSERKKALVCSRLGRRLKQYGLDSYGAYFRLLQGDGAAGELQTAVDLLTTNETFFFREQKHFDFLGDTVLREAQARRRPLRVWSAACSSGEEPYSIAMLLADRLGPRPWEVLASDISTRVLDRARGGIYPMERAEKVPADYLRRFCLKGVGSRAGTFMVRPELRQRVAFRQINLNEALEGIGDFDVIFLRNVMIYFDVATKRQVVARIGARLRPGGHLMVGHSESLNGVTDTLRAIAPSIYRRD